MRTLIIITFLALPVTIWGQLKVEDVLQTSEHFEKANCEVEAYPDWGHMIILDKTRFLSMNFHKRKYFRDSAALVGNYRILGDTLYLTSIRIATELIAKVHMDTVDFDKPGWEWTKKKYKDIKFRITKCEDGNLLLVGFADNRLWYARHDKSVFSLVDRMKEDGRWKYLFR